MIMGNIYHLELLPYLPKKLHDAIEYVKKNIINDNTLLGMHEIDGKHVFAIVSNNKTDFYENKQAEFHRKYLDIQIVIKGTEGMVFSNFPAKGKINEEYLQEKDIAFLATGEDEKTIILQPGDFIVFYPNEVHKPLCAVDGKVGNVDKIVIKIEANSL